MSDKVNKAKAGLMNNKFFPDMSKLKKKDVDVNAAVEKSAAGTKPEPAKQKPKPEKKPVEERKTDEKPISHVQEKAQEDAVNIQADITEAHKAEAVREETVQAKSGEGMSFESKSKNVAKQNGAKLHIVARHDGKNKSTVNLTMPGVFRKAAEKLAKENERPLSYILGLLLEYALEVNPIPEFPAAIGLSMEEPWKTIYHIPSDLKEEISALGAKNGRSLVFTVNALIKYTLETIGELA